MADEKPASEGGVDVRATRNPAIDPRQFDVYAGLRHVLVVMHIDDRGVCIAGTRAGDTNIYRFLGIKTSRVVYTVDGAHVALTDVRPHAPRDAMKDPRPLDVFSFPGVSKMLVIENVQPDTVYAALVHPDKVQQLVIPLAEWPNWGVLPAVVYTQDGAHLPRVDPGGTLGEAMEDALAAAGGALPHPTGGAT